MSAHEYIVGDILVDDNLGVSPAHFFRVTKLIKKSMLELEILKSKRRERTIVAGSATPGGKDKTYPPVKGRVNKNGVVKYNYFGLSRYAVKWVGKPVKYDGPGECC